MSNVWHVRHPSMVRPLHLAAPPGSESMTCGAAQVNARMGGGPVYAMNNFVWGVDMVEEQFLASCGIPSRPYMAKAPLKCIAEFSVNAQKTGRLLNTNWADVSPSSLLSDAAALLYRVLAPFTCRIRELRTHAIHDIFNSSMQLQCCPMAVAEA